MKRPVYSAPADPGLKPKTTREAAGKPGAAQVASKTGPGQAPAIIGLLLIALASLGVLRSRRSAPG